MLVTRKGFRFVIVLHVLVCLISVADAQQNNERPDPRSEFVVLAVSPDGAELAVARSSYDIMTRNGRIELRDLKTGELRQTVTGFDGSISNITFSRDGKSVITTSTEVRQSKLKPKPLDRSGYSVTELKWWDELLATGSGNATSGGKAVTKDARMTTRRALESSSLDSLCGQTAIEYLKPNVGLDKAGSPRLPFCW